MCEQIPVAEILAKRKTIKNKKQKLIDSFPARYLNPGSSDSCDKKDPCDLEI